MKCPCFYTVELFCKRPKEYKMKKECTWKAVGWMDRERSLLLWRSKYSRFRTEVRASPGILRMEFFSRCSSTRLRGRPVGTTLRLLFDKSRHSRLLSWLPGERERKSLNQFSGIGQCVCALIVQQENSHSLCEVDALVTYLKTHKCNYNQDSFTLGNGKNMLEYVNR